VYSVGVDLGGTKILAGLVDETGTIVRTAELPTNAADGPDAVIRRMEAAIRDVIEDVHMSDIRGIGIGAPGPLNPRTGVVLSPPNLPGWKHIPLRQTIGERFHVPTFLENDANAAALAEYRFGAGKGTANMIYLTISTGIGAGLILDGKLYHGAGGFAGEIGHMVVDAHGIECACGNRGCLEALSSGTAIARRAEQLLGRPSSAKEVAQLAAEGDPVAKTVLDEAFYHLGVGLVSLVNTFNPSKIVIGGGVSQIGEVMFQTLTDYVQHHAHPATASMVEIVPAKLGKYSGMLGGAALPLLDSIASSQAS
jgi:glucokinase